MNDRRENELIFNALLNEKIDDKGNWTPEDIQPGDSGLGPLDPEPDTTIPPHEDKASEGEDHEQVGDDNKVEIDKKAELARKSIQLRLDVMPLDQKASIWQAVLEDTNLAGRVIERWDHNLKVAFLEYLRYHGETDWSSDIKPPRPAEKTFPTDASSVRDADDPHSGVGDSNDPEGTNR